MREERMKKIAKKKAHLLPVTKEDLLKVTDQSMLKKPNP